MNIKLHIQNIKVPHSLYDHVHSRLYLTLGRYSGRIRQADVTLLSITDVNNEQGICCQIKLTLHDHQLIILQETAGDMNDAIQNGIQHSKRVLDRHFNRIRRLAEKPQMTRLSAC